MRHAIAVALPRFRRAFEALEAGLHRGRDLGPGGRREHCPVRAVLGLPHGASGSTPCRADQAVLIDAWDKPDGYYYDITRSTFYGKPTDEYRKVWSIVLDAQSAAIDKAAPGVPCSEVDAAARRVIEKAGYGEYFTHRLGHGLGIDVHEPPYMVGHDRTILEPGMTFTSEPGNLPAGPLRRAHRGRHRRAPSAAPSRSRRASDGWSRSRPEPGRQPGRSS